MMTTRIPPLDLNPVFQTHPYARIALESLLSQGHLAVLVGGVVRDAMRGRLEKGYVFAPAEVDIATAATPDQVKDALPDWTSKDVGKSFGVTIVTAPDGRCYEIATFRSESDYDGRRPGRVELIRSLEADLLRRDFTVNGMAAHLDGTVVDRVGGMDDLRQKRIRAIGDPLQRFAEDHLRMLRAVRFACSLDADIEPWTAWAIRSQADKILRISPERIREELFKMLASRRAGRGVRWLDELGLLAEILPEVCALKGVPQPAQYHPEGDVFVHTLLALEWADRLGMPALTKLCVLCHDLGKPLALIKNQGQHMAGHDQLSAALAIQIGKRLRCSSAQVERMAFTARQHMRIARLPEMAQAKRLRLLESTRAAGKSEPLSEKFPALATLLQVLICDAQASVHRSSAWLPVVHEAVACALRLRDLEQQEAAHKLLDGRDVLALGVAPGPQVGAILRQVYEWIYAGKINARDQALRAARALARSSRPE